MCLASVTAYPASGLGTEPFARTSLGSHEGRMKMKIGAENGSARSALGSARSARGSAHGALFVPSFGAMSGAWVSSQLSVFSSLLSSSGSGPTPFVGYREGGLCPGPKLQDITVTLLVTFCQVFTRETQVCQYGRLAGTRREVHWLSLKGEVRTKDKQFQSKVYNISPNHSVQFVQIKRESMKRKR